MGKRKISLLFLILFGAAVLLFSIIRNLQPGVDIDGKFFVKKGDTFSHGKEYITQSGNQLSFALSEKTYDLSVTPGGEGYEVTFSDGNVYKVKSDGVLIFRDEDVIITDNELKYTDSYDVDRYTVAAAAAIITGGRYERRMPAGFLLLGLIFYIVGAALWVNPRLAYTKYIIWHKRELTDIEAKIARASGIFLMVVGVLFMTEVMGKLVG